MVDGGQATLIRRRETGQELFCNDILPA
jgi:hypothetical protein